MPHELFDDLTDVYEAMIDWPQRLAREGPFYRRLLEGRGVRRVLDAACGTGHHAALLHDWGLSVEGADLSPAMIDRARALHGEPEGIRWVVRGFDEPVEPAEPFDAVLCVGNSLALAPDQAAAERAVRGLLAALRPGGLLVLHLLNLWRLPDGPCAWQKCRRADVARGEVLIVKGVHRCGRRGYVDLVVASLDEPPRMQSESASLLGLEAEDLKRTALAGGAAEVKLLGGYEGQPYERSSSIDLIVVATR